MARRHYWVLSCLVTARAFAEPSPSPSYESRVTGAAQERRESAEAVTVYGIGDARVESADLGTVLNRVQGINLARTGGLGSESRFSLNGFSNDQVRFFLDGVPLELAGFSFGVGDIPIDLVGGVEIYRGVVPLRFGADALGGAVNLVSPQNQSWLGGGFSLQAGSFSTLRFSAGAHHRSRRGLYQAAGVYIDSTLNDYPVSVQIPDSNGRLHDSIVPLFHNAYDARGGFADVGVVNQPWADKIVLRLYYSEYDKQLQNNAVMTVPYGAAAYGESVAGGSLSLAHRLGAVSIDLTASYSHRTTHFKDISTDVYDWLGDIIHQRLEGGEIDGEPHDITLYRDTIYGRLNLAWQLAPHHTLSVVSSTSYDESHGVSHVGLPPDPLAASRTLLKIVSGIEYHANLSGDVVDNMLFIKHYYMHAAATELLTGTSFSPLRLDQDTAGAGDSLRIRLYRKLLYAKASYEYATRLPTSTEIFGDGILVVPNGKLIPERSHNANLGVGFDARHTRAGAFDGELNGFLRAADNLIVLLATSNSFSYNNVYAARALGIESLAHWRSPRDWVTLEASLTYQDLRNVSSSGAYAAYRDQRLPNLPWLFFNTALRFQYRFINNVIALTWYTRYVHQFDRDWASLGAPQYQQSVATQFSQSLSLSYSFHSPGFAGSLAFDAEDFTNERLYDYYGVQRPGRAFYVKTTLQF